MFDEIRISLYNFFGYLLPGAAILFAVAVVFWALFWPHAALTLPSSLPALATTVLLFAAYLAGHLAQALGNTLEKISYRRAKLDAELPLSAEAEKMLMDTVANRFGESARKLGPRELYQLCDQSLVHSGSLGEREIFTYREGFYRGNSVALAFVCLAIGARVVASPTAFVLLGKNYALGRVPLALASALFGVSAWLCFRRFLRFAEYRFRSCFFRFLASANEKSDRAIRH